MKKIFFTAIVFVTVSFKMHTNAQLILTPEEAVATALKNNYDIQ